MRLAFAGTPAFALPALEALRAAGHEVAAVYTQPDRPAGRGRALRASAVAARAQALGLPVHKPERLTPEVIAGLRGLAPEAMVVVAYGLILPQAVLGIPQYGCLNIHASLLPRLRGAAPVAHAILAGDRETGVTIMRMDAGLDTGPILLQEKIPIAPDATAGDLHDALAALGARLIVAALDGVQAERLVPRPQPAQGASYAPKLDKAEARLDWSQPAARLARQVRAYNPAPVAWAELDGERLRIYKARALPAHGSHAPGTVLDTGAAGIAIATGDGVLLIETLQRPGGKVLSGAEAARGRDLAGKRFA